MSQVGHPRITAAQRIQPVCVLDRREDRRRVVRLVVDSRFGEVGADDQGRDARPRAVVIVWPVGRRGTLPGRRDVIPLATELVVSNEDERLLAVWAVENGFEQVDPGSTFTPK